LFGGCVVPWTYDLNARHIVDPALVLIISDVIKPLELYREMSNLGLTFVLMQERRVITYCNIPTGYYGLKY